MAHPVRIAPLLLAALAACASAQDTSKLDLPEALRLAKARNGTVRAALYDVKAAQARVNQAYSQFLPTITPSYVYNSNRSQGRLGGTGFTQTEGGSSTVDSTWRILDSGQRDLSFRSASRAREATRFNAVQTLRTTLFNVTQQFYDTLRAQALQRVADAQVAQTEEILRATDLRIQLGDAARIERLQANVDVQNSRVQALSARNTTTTAAATLKATVGLDTDNPLPPLQDDQTVVSPEPLPPMATLVKEGITDRPDLIASRRNIESLRFQTLRAERDAGLTGSLDASFNEQITPHWLQNRTLTFALSYPLFDGFRSREAARELQYTTKASAAQLQQAERQVRADIEAAYAELATNGERLAAAQVARDAANENYQAAIGSQRAGAYNLLQVTAAQVSYVTAQSSLIQATYDYKISQVRLNLVTGRPVPGE